MQGQYSRDGRFMRRDQIDKYYSRGAGLTLVSMGFETNFDLELEKTCKYVISHNGKSETAATMKTCKEDYIGSLNNWDEIKRLDIVTNVTIVDGMSGGVCVDAYEPLEFIGVTSHGLEYIVGPPSNEIKFGIANVATLLSKSRAVAEYREKIQFSEQTN